MTLSPFKKSVCTFCKILNKCTFVQVSKFIHVNTQYPCVHKLIKNKFTLTKKVKGHKFHETLKNNLWILDKKFLIFLLKKFLGAHIFSESHQDDFFCKIMVGYKWRDLICISEIFYAYTMAKKLLVEKIKKLTHLLELIRTQKQCTIHPYSGEFIIMIRGGRND